MSDFQDMTHVFKCTLASAHLVHSSLASYRISSNTSVKSIDDVEQRSSGLVKLIRGG